MNNYIKNFMKVRPPWYILLISFSLGATLVSLAFSLCGCASTSGIYTSRQGDKLEARSTRFLWQTEHVRMAMQTNGLPEVEVNNTQPDAKAITASAEAIGAVIGAAAKAAAIPK